MHFQLDRKAAYLDRSADLEEVASEALGVEVTLDIARIVAQEEPRLPKPRIPTIPMAVRCAAREQSEGFDDVEELPALTREGDLVEEQKFATLMVE